MGELDDLRESLKESFSRVKKDIATHDREIEEIKDMISDINQKLDLLVKNAKKRERLSDFPYETRGSQQSVSVRQDVRQKDYSNLEKEFFKKFKKNKKDIIKARILDLIKRDKFSRSELKSIVVDQFKYCSKASFYRYLREMERSGQVSLVNSNKKDYFIISKISSQ